MYAFESFVTACECHQEVHVVNVETITPPAEEFDYEQVIIADNRIEFTWPSEAGVAEGVLSFSQEAAKQFAIDLMTASNTIDRLRLVN